MILVHSPPSNATLLLQGYMELLSDDCEYNLKTKGVIKEPSAKDVHSYFLFLLKKQLDLHDRTFQQVGLNIDLSNLNAFESSDQGIQAPKYLRFLDGPGGSEETFLLNCILLECEKLKLHVAAICASGIAALLLLNGTTAHSAFGIPLNVQEDSTCS
ncbi:hypothetical protein O181_010808 [Austropuccinia psidii MF-1]|uniref:ATP-dependent DNA helicase n=1 Tax=Austropuccinia psidii MF-1 TaxID=1389203 RepID=A0A9Q3BTR5_9BASI|nr:hypothetical protein [Austropuccinia psidii MF-1]